MLVYCDECLKEYEPEFKVKKVKDDIEETYFKCPHCKHKYTAFYTNRSIRQQQTKLRNTYKKFDKKRLTNHQLQFWLNVVKARTEKIEKEMKELKEEINNES